MKSEYHSKQTLDKIRKWPILDIFNCIPFIQELWCWKYMHKTKWTKIPHVKHPVLQLSLSTGGWSGNEDIINAMLQNPTFKIAHEKWEHGGHYTFIFDPYRFGFRTVKEHCEINQITRQAVHKSPHKYEWITASPKIRFVRPIPYP